MSKKKHRKKHGKSFKKASSPAVVDMATASPESAVISEDSIHSAKDVKKILVIMAVLVAIVAVIAIVNSKTSAIENLGERLLEFMKFN